MCQSQLVVPRPPLAHQVWPLPAEFSASSQGPVPPPERGSWQLSISRTSPGHAEAAGAVHLVTLEASAEDRAAQEGQPEWRVLLVRVAQAE